MEENELEKKPNYSRAWRGSWNRPMKIDEDSQHPLTIARMTDHNVRGLDSGLDERSLLIDAGKDSKQAIEKKAA